MTSKGTPEGPQNDLIQPLKIPKIAQKEAETHQNDLKVSKQPQNIVKKMQSDAETIPNWPRFWPQNSLQ